MTTAAPPAPPTATPALELTRSVPFRVRSAEDAGDGLTIDGYAAVFGQLTEIDSWEGSFQEQFRMGAFRKTLRERTPLMQYDHGMHPLIGSIPIGRYDSLTEETQGLHVIGRLTDNWLIQPVRDAIADGGITGMSIRFAVVKDEWVDANGKRITDPQELAELLWAPGDRGPIQRTVTEVKLLEAGPVCWPAYEQTSVDVRAAARAREILADPARRRLARQSLAAAAPVELARDVDPRALAVELLRAGVTDDTPSGPESPEDPEETPVAETTDPADTPNVPAAEPQVRSAPATTTAPAAVTETRTTGEPPAGHSPRTQDAPPAAGHSSPTEQDVRRQVARRLQATLTGVRKRY